MTFQPFVLGGAFVLLSAAAASAQVVTQQVIVSGSDQGPMQVLPPGRQAKTGTAIVRGRVVTADTGAALRRAQVRISGPDIGSKGALTDANGRYEFKDLPAGRFNVSVAKAGFVNMQYGQRRPFEPGRPIELTDAQLLDKIDIAMPRGSVLAGRVVDEFGEPVADAMVSAMRMQFVNGRRRLMNAGRTATTNDLGQYRLYGLSPGEYYVSATLRSMESMIVDVMGSNGPGGPSGSNNNSGYAPTYYPGTPSPSEAQRVSVGVGQELSSVDVALQPVRLAKITGTAISSDGKPMAGAMIMLMPAARDAMMFMPGGTSRTNGSGQFTLNGVAPGEYTLQLRSMGAIMSEVAGAASMMFAVKTDDTPSSSAPQEAEFATVPLSVSGEDISGLTIATTHGAKGTGRVIFDGGAKPDNVTTVRVGTPSADVDGAAIGSMPVAIKDNGTFELTGLMGTRLIRVTNPPKGWYLQGVRYNGEDVTDTGIEFKPGEDVNGIDVVLTQRSTTLTGSVTDDRGEPAKDYTVVVFPKDQQKWTLPNNRWISSGRPDQSGQFRIANLPPGAYYAVAVEYVAAGEWSDPDWLQRAREKATGVTLSEGGSATLELKISSF